MGFMAIMAQRLLDVPEDGFSMLKISGLFIAALLLTACASQGVPSGSVAWCGAFDYTGTVTKTETNGRALGLSDSELASRLTVDDVIKLAESMGCSE